MYFLLYTHLYEMNIYNIYIVYVICYIYIYNKQIKGAGLNLKHVLHFGILSDFLSSSPFILHLSHCFSQSPQTFCGIVRFFEQTS